MIREDAQKPRSPKKESNETVLGSILSMTDMYQGPQAVGEKKNKLMTKCSNKGLKAGGLPTASLESLPSFRMMATTHRSGFPAVENSRRLAHTQDCLAS